MPDSGATLLGGTALLERAVGYTLGSLRLVTPRSLDRATPCAEWDLRALLTHLDDSLAALQEAADHGSVVVGGPRKDVDSEVDPVAALRNRACTMIGAWTGDSGAELVSVGGCPVPIGYVTGAGAVEIAVHGWDVARSCGQDRPIPARLAEELLELCYALVLPADRPARFAAPVAVSPWSPADHRLLAYVGRRP